MTKQDGITAEGGVRTDVKRDDSFVDVDEERATALELDTAIVRGAPPEARGFWSKVKAGIGPPVIKPPEVVPPMPANDPLVANGRDGFVVRHADGTLEAFHVTREAVTKPRQPYEGAHTKRGAVIERVVSAGTISQANASSWVKPAIKTNDSPTSAFKTLQGLYRKRPQIVMPRSMLGGSAPKRKGGARGRG